MLMLMCRHRHCYVMGVVGVAFRPGGGVRDISGEEWEDVGWQRRTMTNVVARVS